MKTLHLSPLDGAVTLGFVLLVLALGFSARLRENTVLQFLAAGRKLTLPAFVATLVSTWYGSILGVGESVGLFGLSALLLIGVPYYLFAFVYALFFARKVRAAEQISLPERLEQRWGKGPALVGAGIVLALAIPAAHVLMLGVLVSSFTGWELFPSTLAAAGIGSLFLYKGGLLADVRVGLLAFLMMYVGFGTIVGWCLIHHPPQEALATLPASFRTLAAPDWLQFLGFLILGAWTLVDPGFHQRVASSASPEIGRRGVFVSVGFWVLFDLLTITTGLYAVALLQPTPENPLLLFPMLGDRVLPPGLKAVFLCGMLGTIVSAMVGYALVSGATVGREIWARWSGRLSESQVQARIRLGIALSLALAIGLAQMMGQSVVALWYSWAGAGVGALLFPIMIAYGIGPRIRLSPRWAAWTMGLTFALVFAALLYGVRTGNPYLDVQMGERRFSLGTVIPGLGISGILIALGAVCNKRGTQTP